MRDDPERIKRDKYMSNWNFIPEYHLMIMSEYHWKGVGNVLREKSPWNRTFRVGEVDGIMR